MRRGMPWVLWSVAAVLWLSAVVLLGAGRDLPMPNNWGFRGYWIVLIPAVAMSGLLVARRQPRNPIGWLLLVGGVAGSFGAFAQEYAGRAFILGTPLPGALAIAWISTWSWSLAAGPMLTLIPQLFPTGRPVSARWMPLVWGGFAFPPLSFVIFTLKPGPMENATFADNPLAVSGSLAEVIAMLTPWLGAFMALIVIGSGASLAVRFRRARDLERQQMKWVAASAALLATAFAVMLATDSSKPAQVAVVFALMTLPVAIGLAILRYRLYEIDVLIRRTLVYAAISAILAAAYISAVVLFEFVLTPFTAGNGLAVAISTLAVLALFQPVRDRVRDAVDRRFYRSRYDAARTLDAFAVTMRDQVALDAVRADLIDAAGATVQPAHASLWLRDAR